MDFSQIKNYIFNGCNLINNTQLNLRKKIEFDRNLITLKNFQNLVGIHTRISPKRKKKIPITMVKKKKIAHTSWGNFDMVQNDLLGSLEFSILRE